MTTETREAILTARSYIQNADAFSKDELIQLLDQSIATLEKANKREDIHTRLFALACVETERKLSRMPKHPTPNLENYSTAQALKRLGQPVTHGGMKSLDNLACNHREIYKAFKNFLTQPNNPKIPKDGAPPLLGKTTIASLDLQRIAWEYG